MSAARPPAGAGVAGDLLIAGGGIGGLAAAVAARRAGWRASVLEQAEAFGEAGAGIQLGPNVTRILHEWSLLRGDLAQQAFAPPWLRVRDGVDGAELACLALGDMTTRYGAPYLTVHRADLHAHLLAAARDLGADLHAGRRLHGLQAQEGGVRAAASPGPQVQADAALVADGLWSDLRNVVAEEGLPLATGHLAYRGLVRQADLPAVLRSHEVTVWLAPRMHLVTYPVRGGDVLNVVCLVEGRIGGDPRLWDHQAVRAELESALGPVAAGVRDRLAAVPAWRLWALHDRPPVRSAAALARGPIALLGDAAHPMLPYLAQGAGMAIEDARELQRVLAMVDAREGGVAMALQRYASNRWRRVAKVQQRSRRNARVFHADGALRLARNLALRALGSRMLDQKWLFAGG